MQLNDGTEVKAYRLRTSDGGMDPWSAIYWIDREGRTEHVYGERLEWREEAYWKSPKSGLRYPVEVRVEATHPVTGKTQVYHIEPYLRNQEFTGQQSGNAYWEGACRVLDEQGQQIGEAYLELAGYGEGLGALQ